MADISWINGNSKVTLDDVVTSIIDAQNENADYNLIQTMYTVGSQMFKMNRMQLSGEVLAQQLWL